MTSYHHHPYYPKDANLSGIFIPKSWSVVQLITTFAAGWAVILGTTLLTVRRVNSKLKVSDQALVLWFVLSEYCTSNMPKYFLVANPT